MKIKRLPAKECRRPHVTQFHDSKIKYDWNLNQVFSFVNNHFYSLRFPMVNKATKRLHHPRFTTRRPHTYF
jgi:large subunit ribosomal protein L18Ae